MAPGRPLIAGLIVIAAALGCRRDAPAPAKERQQEVVPVGAVVAQTAGIRAVIRASGIVVPAEGGEFLAGPPEPARILEITKSEGDPVASGDVLVRFELPSASQDVARFAADLAGAEARLENARINQSRVRDFVDKGFVPRRDLEAAERELADAQAAVTRVRAGHAAAEAAAARAVVRAPFNGIVATRSVFAQSDNGPRQDRLYVPGDFVSSSTEAVLRIVDPRRLEVVAQVPHTDIARVVPGASARVAGPREAEPVRLTVVGRLSAAGGNDTLPVRLTFVEPAPLAVDTRIEVDIDAEERTDAILLPAEAVIRDVGQAVIFVANGSTAERRVVTTGIADDERVEITSGLKAGELVITRGHIGLPDGAAVSVDVAR